MCHRQIKLNYYHRLFLQLEGERGTQGMVVEVELVQRAVSSRADVS